MHTMRHAVPDWEFALLLLFVPPVGAIIWKVLAFGWAAAVQGGTLSTETKKRQKFEFWSILIALYIVSLMGLLARLGYI